MHPFIVLIYRDMRKEYENFFTNFEQQEPPKDLFGRIILAIKREQESRRTKRLLLKIGKKIFVFFAHISIY